MHRQSETDRSRRRRTHSILPVGGGVADRFRRRSRQIGKARLQFLDDTRRVIHRQRGLRDEAKIVFIIEMAGVRILDGFNQRDRASGNCPIVPITSGWPEWPIRMTWRPRRWWRMACLCTLETSGHVASR